MIVGWQGQTLGDGVRTWIQSAQGLEDWLGSAANLDGPGDGAVAAPVFRQPGAFTLGIVVFGDSDEDMAANVAWLKGLFSNGSIHEAMTFQLRGEPEKAIYCRLLSRSVPTAFDSGGRYAAMLVTVTMDAPDPMVYGPEISADLTQDVPFEFTPEGWGASLRFRWIAHGRLVNPRLTFSFDGGDDQVLRFVGTVNEGQNLLWESEPRRLVSTVGGFNRYGDFDGGVHTIPPPLITLPAVATSVLLTAADGDGDGSFRFRAAQP